MSSRIVKVLNDAELKELQQIYVHHVPYATHVCSLMLTYFKWKKSHPDNNYLIFYALEDDWRKSGTFIVKFKSFDVFVFTLDKTGEDLYSLLHESKAFQVQPQIDQMVIYGTRNEFLPSVYKSLKELEIPIKKAVSNKFYWLPKEEALKFSIDCPKEVYIGKLRLTDVDLICSLWPHASAGSEEYISTYLKMNGGYGVFLKENDQLVSWILQNFWGTLTVLETVPEHKKKGYGLLITKKMCREVAMEGINPVATIVDGNTASVSLFTKLGFECIGDCTFVLY